MSNRRTVLVTGASRGIGAAVVETFLEHGYQVAANSLTFSRGEFTDGPNLALVEGDIGLQDTAERLIATAMSRFGSIDHVINNAGIFVAKSFTDYSVHDLARLMAANLNSFVFVTQSAVRQMLLQSTGGSVIAITAALASNPMVGVPASIAMMTKGALNALTLSLANEYAARGIRFNAVAPGVVDTPMHAAGDKDNLKKLTPMGVISEAKDIADAVLYLTEARFVTGEVLHVDGGAHVGKW